MWEDKAVGSWDETTEAEDSTEKTERIAQNESNRKFDIVLDIIKVHTNYDIGE